MLKNLRNTVLCPEFPIWQAHFLYAGLYVEQDCGKEIVLENPDMDGQCPPRGQWGGRRGWIRNIQKARSGGWRDSSVIKSTDCSSRGSWFISKHPHSSLQIVYNSNPRRSNTRFYLPRPPGTRMVHRHTLS